MSRTYIISPDPFLVMIKDEEGNSYSCNHLDMIELEVQGKDVPSPGQSVSKSPPGTDAPGGRIVLLSFCR